jgi:hypothetical protein
MSAKMNTVKAMMITLLTNNTVNTCENAYQTAVKAMKVTLSTTEKARVIHEVIVTLW